MLNANRRVDITVKIPEAFHIFIDNNRTSPIDSGHGGLRSVTFLVPSLGRFLGRDVCLGLQRSQGGRVF